MKKGIVIVAGLVGTIAIIALSRRVIAAEPLSPEDIYLADLIISPAIVEPYEPVRISVTITNISDRMGSYTLTLGGDFKAQKTVTLEPGESKVVTFEVTPKVAKTYSVSVDGLYGSFEATEVGVAAWSVVLGVSNMTPEVGEVIQWWVDITNIGTAQGTALVKYFRDMYILPYTHSVTVNPGQTRRDYASSLNFATPGDHVLAVVADDASDSLTIMVEEEALANLDIQVKDETGNPMEDVLFRVDSLKALTDPSGAAAFTDLELGPHQGYCYKEGYEIISIKLNDVEIPFSDGNF